MSEKVESKQNCAVSCSRFYRNLSKGPFIATQLNSTQLDVELLTRSQREQLSPISSERRDPVDSLCR